MYKSTVDASPRLMKFVFSCFISLLLLISFTPAHGQVWVNGYLKDRVSRIPIVNAEVRSSFSNTLSDSNGFFRIRVKEGDIVSAKKFGYRFDTIHFSFHNIDSLFLIYIEPLGSIMQNVTVRTSYSAYQVDSLRRRMYFDEARSKTSFVSKHHAGFGLVFNIDRLTKSRDKNLKKQKAIFEKTEQWAYIRFRFSDSIVRSYTGLSDDSLRNFMTRYTPSYQWLRDHPSKIELVYYINDKIKLFRKEQDR